MCAQVMCAQANAWLQGERTLHDATPQESSTFTGLAASSGEDSDVVPPKVTAHANSAEGGFRSSLP